MDAAVGDEPLDRLFRDLAAIRIEAREDDRARRVVDDEIDAGRLLERADVASLAADDAPLQIVARQIHDRHRGLRGVLGGAALDGLGDVLARLRSRLLARLCVEALHQIRGVAPRVGFDVLQQEVFGFFGRQPRQALELVLLRGDELLVFRRRRRTCCFLTFGDGLRLRLQLLLLALGGRHLVAEGRFPAPQLLFGVRQLLGLFAGDPLGLGAHLVRFFLGLEQRLLLAGFGVALGVLHDAQRLLFRAADGLGGDALAIGDPVGEHRSGGHQRDGAIDEIHQIEAHDGSLNGSGLSVLGFWIRVPGSEVRVRGWRWTGNQNLEA